MLNDYGNLLPNHRNNAASPSDVQIQRRNELDRRLDQSKEPDFLKNDCGVEISISEKAWLHAKEFCGFLSSELSITLPEIRIELDGSVSFEWGLCEEDSMIAMGSLIFDGKDVLYSFRHEGRSGVDNSYGVLCFSTLSFEMLFGVIKKYFQTPRDESSARPRWH